MIRRLPAPLLVLLLVAGAGHASADELHLRNGDRLTGTVTSLKSGTLVFKTGHGDVRVKWDDVVALTVDEPIVVTAADGKRGTVTGAIDLPGVTALRRPTPPVAWSGGVSAGYLATGGNTRVSSLHFDADLLAQAPAYRYASSATINRARDSGRTTSRNWTFSTGYDRFISPRIYLNSNAIFTNDAFRELDLRTALGVGLGFQLVDTSTTTIAVEAGVGWVNENLRAVAGTNYTSLRESGRMDVFFGGDRVVLFHRHDGYFGVTGGHNRFVKTQNGARVGLGKGFVASMQLDVDYDGSPATGRRHTDRSLSMNLGYRF